MMKKYILLPLLIAVIPNVVFGSTARYSKLLHEKQRKMEQLEKCMGVSKGLKIAGVSTLGLTAVGVVGNIAEAKAIKENVSTMEKNTKKIGDLQKKIDEKDKQIKEKETREREKAERLELAQLECSAMEFYEWNPKKKKCVLVDANGECSKRGGEYDSDTKSCLCNEKKMKSNEQCSDNTISEIPLPDLSRINEEFLENYGITISAGDYEDPEPVDFPAEEEEPETIEDLADYIDRMSDDTLKVGSAITVPTEWLGQGDIPDKINTWKDFCISICHGDIHCTTDVTEKEVGSYTLFSCKITECKPDTEYKLSDDGLKCEPITPKEPKINCTPEFLEQNNAVTGVECGEEEQLDMCCIKTCKPGYHTTLNGEDHPVNSNDDLDTELICEPLQS